MLTVESSTQVLCGKLHSDEVVQVLVVNAQDVGAFISRGRHESIQRRSHIHLILGNQMGEFLQAF